MQVYTVVNLVSVRIIKSENTIKYISILVFVFGVSFAFAQTPPPPNNGIPRSGGITQGIPAGDGVLILLAEVGADGYARWKNQVPDYHIEE